MCWIMQFAPEDRCWCVGYYCPDGKFRACWDFEKQDEAAAQINYLNGGAGVPRFDPKELEAGNVD